MDVIKTFAGWLGRRRPLPTRYADGWQAGTVLDDTKTGPVSGFAALRRGLEIVGGQLVSTPLLTFEGGVEMPDSEIAKYLAATNPADLETSVVDMLYTGNGWLFKAQDRLENVQAFRMSAVVKDGAIAYMKDGKQIKESDYVHLMCRNHTSPYLGDALVESYSASVASVLGTQVIFNQLQGNSAYAEMIFTTENPLTRDQMQQLRTAYIEQTAANAGKLGGTIILSNGLKPMTVRRLPTALDADIVDALNFSVAEAARMTGVPLQMLGVKDATAYASATEMQRSFYRVTMRPIMHRVEQELSRKLGADIRYDVGEIVMGFGVERAETLSKLIMAGVITINEARDAISYGPIADGDINAMPINYSPFDRWRNPPPPAAPAAPAVPAGV